MMALGLILNSCTILQRLVLKGHDGIIDVSHAAVNYPVTG